MAVTFGFGTAICFILIQFARAIPIAKPIPKQAKPKLSTASILSTVSISLAPLSWDSLASFIIERAKAPSNQSKGLTVYRYQAAPANPPFPASPQRHYSRSGITVQQYIFVQSSQSINCWIIFKYSQFQYAKNSWQFNVGNLVPILPIFRQWSTVPATREFDPMTRGRWARREAVRSCRTLLNTKWLSCRHWLTIMRISAAAT